MSVWTNIALSGAPTGTGTWTGTYSNLNDASDATLVKKTSAGAGDYRDYPTTDVTVPTNEVVAGMRWRCRMSRPSYQTSVSIGLFGVGELNVRSGAGAQSFAGFTSIATVTGPWLMVNETGFYSSLTGIRTPTDLTQAEVTAARVRITDLTVTANVAQFYELGLDLLTASIPAVTVSAPSGTVVDNLAPPIIWAHSDYSTATVTQKVLTSYVAVLTTSAPHGFQVGNDVTVSIGDAVFDGVFKISAVTSTTFSYARVNANVSVVSASGTATIGDGASQNTYEVKVFTAAQYGLPDFDPSVSASTWFTSGTSSTTGSVTPAQLANATTFRAYVRTSKVTSLGQVVYSSWVYSTFTTAATLPPAPVVTATFDAVNSRVVLAIRNGGNLLSSDDASAEATVGSWVVLTNTAAPVRVSTVATHGTWSVRMSSNAAGSMTMRTGSGLAGYAVEEGQTYCATAAVRAGASARYCRVGVQFYDDTGAALGGIVYGSAVMSSTSAWTTLTCDVLAPSLAVFAAVVVEVQATSGASELHYADAIGLAAGAGTAWSPGGRTYSITVERTQGGLVKALRGGSALIPGAAGTISVYDYEAVREQAVAYTATVTATATGAAVVSIASTSAPLTPSSDGTWWLKAVSLPALNRGSVPAVGAPQSTTEENLGVFRLDGRSDTVVVAGQIFGDDPDYTIQARGVEEIDGVRALLRYQGTLLVQEPWLDQYGFGRQRYVRITSRSRTDEGTVEDPRSTFTIRCVEVGPGY